MPGRIFRPITVMKKVSSKMGKGVIMGKRKGFTLVELMVVVLIVTILAAVAMPLLSGRIDSSKWSEANAGAGTIRTAVRAYFAENPTSVNAQGFATITVTGGSLPRSPAGSYTMAANGSWNKN